MTCSVSALIVMLLGYEKKVLNNTDNRYTYNKAAACRLSGCSKEM